MTMGDSWAYKPDETAWKNPVDLVENLMNVVSRGGNYLLNEGPTSDGVFSPEAVERMQYVGRWTRRDDKGFLHVFKWPSDGNLSISAKVRQRRVLKLPECTALRALIIMTVSAVLFGRLLLDGLIYLISPEGLSNWAYIAVKTFYTGAAGSIAVVLALWSVVNDNR
ncbi:MAG: alpha-L-fucosidase [Spirochaetales bacterium]|nr:alpha-L-fucosidase [Spirochaetales bacterium]